MGTKRKPYPCHPHYTPKYDETTPVTMDPNSYQFSAVVAGTTLEADSYDAISRAIDAAIERRMQAQAPITWTPVLTVRPGGLAVQRQWIGTRVIGGRTTLFTAEWLELPGDSDDARTTRARRFDWNDRRHGPWGELPMYPEKYDWNGAPTGRSTEFAEVLHLAYDDAYFTAATRVDTYLREQRAAITAALRDPQALLSLTLGGLTMET